jgi:hypothetical protein
MNEMASAFLQGGDLREARRLHPQQHIGGGQHRCGVGEFRIRVLRIGKMRRRPRAVLDEHPHSE